ncbi:hypothetical protein [Ammonifex thiophilus]|uniref:Uncharacterized protein n=1 Tax=Ammonifex thiophilus TaxID=444093 RepID=A0A3D8P1B7_9THEO|nr:hypothetical protein [Ammonifex thiophilus]RDV81230.1 hypothetical protein DXX99_09610 [Ammonifex thiophilus]
MLCDFGFTQRVLEDLKNNPVCPKTLEAQAVAVLCAQQREDAGEETVLASLAAIGALELFLFGGDWW